MDNRYPIGKFVNLEWDLHRKEQYGLMKLKNYQTF